MRPELPPRRFVRQKVDSKQNRLMLPKKKTRSCSVLFKKKHVGLPDVEQLLNNRKIPVHVQLFRFHLNIEFSI
jgi:hypothetical protein